MSIAKDLVGRWRREYDDGSHTIVVLDDDGDFVWKVKAKGGIEKLVSDLGDLRGKWGVSGSTLILRNKKGDDPVAKIVRIIPHAAAAIWILDLLGKREEQRLKISDLKRNSVRIGGKKFKRG